MPDLAASPVHDLLLTVLIPTRNRWGLLSAQARSIDLVLRETGAAFELIIHDNSIQPPPAGLVEGLPQSARYIRSPELFDTAEENICEAFQHCRGEYVWLLADDDGVEAGGVADLLDILREGEEDIIVFNSRHGRDERLAGHGAYVTERARRIFYGKTMRCPISTFVERTGFFYWICAISTVVVRRSIAPVEPLRKYLGIARIYAHVAWLIEIGKDRRFLFVNRPLVVYGLLPTDHDGGRHWRSVGIREGGYSNAVWTGLWLRVLDELVEQGALTVHQIRRTSEMNHATRFNFGSNLAHQVLEQLGEMPEPTPAEDQALMATWLVRLFPGAIFLTALIEEIAAFTARHHGSLLRIGQDSRFDQAVRAHAVDLRERAAWWRRAIGETPWYTRSYVETLHLYDIYDLGSDWVAAHVSFGGLREALEVIDLPSLPPAFLRAPTYSALRECIEAQPLEVDALQALRTAALPLPTEWTRLGPESLAPHVHVSPTAIVAAPASTADLATTAELASLQHELARQDAQLELLYGSTSWRLTHWLRRLAGSARSISAARASAPLATLELGERLPLGSGRADAYLVRGFSSSEAWGCWTDGATAVFRCRHPAMDVAGWFEVWPHMAWTGGGARPCVVDVAINRGRSVRVEVRAGEMFAVRATRRDMGSPELEVTFRIRTPKASQEEPETDPRALGVGVAAVRLRVDGGAEQDAAT